MTQKNQRPASLREAAAGTAAKTTKKRFAGGQNLCLLRFLLGKICSEYAGRRGSSQHAESAQAPAQIFALLSPAPVGKTLRRSKLPEVA
jgi:hypothetical protein